MLRLNAAVVSNAAPTGTVQVARSLEEDRTKLK